MRRWPLWIGGSVLLIALALLAATLVLGRTAPFAFLEGQQPMPVPDAVKKMVSRYGGEVTVYSFKGNYGSLIRKAAAELKGEGYKDVYKDYIKGDFPYQPFYYVKGDMSSWMGSTTKSSPTMPDMRTVMIEKDNRYVRRRMGGAGTLVPQPAQGWVTVTIMGKRETNFFTRLRQWLGL